MPKKSRCKSISSQSKKNKRKERKLKLKTTLPDVGPNILPLHLTYSSPNKRERTEDSEYKAEMKRLRSKLGYWKKKNLIRGLAEENDEHARTVADAKCEAVIARLNEKNNDLVNKLRRLQRKLKKFTGDRDHAERDSCIEKISNVEEEINLLVTGEAIPATLLLENKKDLAVFKILEPEIETLFKQAISPIVRKCGGNVYHMVTDSVKLNV